MRKLFSIILTTFLLVSCAGRGTGVLPEVLDHNDLKTARAMVAEYDKFISLQLHDQNMPISDAYATYLQFNAPFAKAAFETDNFMPAAIRIIEVIDELGPQNVKSFLVFDKKCETLRIARDGQYTAILERLAGERGIYKQMLANVTPGDGPIEGDWLVIDQYGSMDFSRADERLVFLLNVFTIPKRQLIL